MEIQNLKPGDLVIILNDSPSIIDKYSMAARALHPDQDTSLPHAIVMLPENQTMLVLAVRGAYACLMGPPFGWRRTAGLKPLNR